MTVLRESEIPPYDPALAFGPGEIAWWYESDGSGRYHRRPAMKDWERPDTWILLGDPAPFYGNGWCRTEKMSPKEQEQVRSAHVSECYRSSVGEVA